MRVHWEDLELIRDALVSWDCVLDPATGHFTDDDVRGYPLLKSVRSRPDEREAWGKRMVEPPPEAVVRGRERMRALRKRRAYAAELGGELGDKLLRVLDVSGSPEQDAAFAEYAAGRQRPQYRAAIEATIARLARDRHDRDDAIMWVRAATCMPPTTSC